MSEETRFGGRSECLFNTQGAQHSKFGVANIFSINNFKRKDLNYDRLFCLHDEEPNEARGTC